MKTPILFFFAIIALCVSCGPRPIPDAYRLRFPTSPASRLELLGESCWRLEYYDSKGNFRQKEITAGTKSAITIDVLQEWPNAILACPYWPEKALAAGQFFPAGALFPLDASGGTITLSWEAGAEAYFFRELERAQDINAGTNRIPTYFDWIRFRSLLRENVNPELRADPWLADWKDIAERTVRSGFRQSYVQAGSVNAIDIIIPHDGPWISASSFITPRLWAADEEQTLFVPARGEIFVCPGGKLSVSAQTSLWIPFP